MSSSTQPLQFLSATFMGIVFWEYIIWLPNEVHVWRKLAGRVRDPVTRRRARPSIGEGLAIWMRYAVVACSISVAVLDFGRPTSCQAAESLTWAFGSLAWAGISMLFTLRLYIMYDRSRVVLALFGFIWAAALAMWVAVAATWRATAHPELVPAGAPWCIQTNDKSWRTANMGAEMAFDLLVLIATLYRLRQLHAATSGITVAGGSSRRMKAFILRSNLGYFVVSFVLSCAAFIVQTTVSDVVFAEILLPPTLSLTPIVAIRIVFSATNDAAMDDLLPSVPSAEDALEELKVSSERVITTSPAQSDDDGEKGSPALGRNSNGGTIVGRSSTSAKRNGKATTSSSNNDSYPSSQYDGPGSNNAGLLSERDAYTLPRIERLSAGTDVTVHSVPPFTGWTKCEETDPSTHA